MKKLTILEGYIQLYCKSYNFGKSHPFRFTVPHWHKKIAGQLPLSVMLNNKALY